MLKFIAGRNVENGNLKNVKGAKITKLVPYFPLPWLFTLKNIFNDFVKL